MGREMPDMGEGHGDQSFSFLFLGSDRSMCLHVFKILITFVCPLEHNIPIYTSATSD